MHCWLRRIFNASIIWWKEITETLRVMKAWSQDTTALFASFRYFLQQFDLYLCNSEPGVHRPVHAGDAQHGGALHWPPLQSDRRQGLRGQGGQQDWDSAHSAVWWRLVGQVCLRLLYIYYIHSAIIELGCCNYLVHSTLGDPPNDYICYTLQHDAGVTSRGRRRES